MTDKRFITLTDYQRIHSLIESAAMNTMIPDRVLSLHKELKIAEMFPQDQIPKDTITMNSKVFLKEIASGREAEIIITYPKDADSREKKISVFSSIGVALLGKRVGEVVSWEVPTGHNQFEISGITYQPEAAGDFHL